MFINFFVPIGKRNFLSSKHRMNVEGQRSMKANFQNLFSQQNKVQYWTSIYHLNDFAGDCLRQRMSRALSWIGAFAVNRDLQILDAGCGAGILVHEAVNKGYKIIGMDYSYSMLKNAKGPLNHEGDACLKLCQGDVESLPYTDSIFDAVISLGVIPFLPSENKAINEFNRVLKPDGILILSIVNRASLVRYMDLPVLLKKIILKIIRRRIAHKKNAGNNTYIASKSHFIPHICMTLKQSGFALCEYETIPLELPTFLGRELFGHWMAIRIALLFEKFSHLPFVGSFGYMCIIKAQKIPPM